MSQDDDWTAAAADRMIRETRLAADRLRSSGVQPLGLVPGTYPPMPAHVFFDSYGPASDRGPGGVVTAVGIRYGDAADPSATVIDVVSDFTPEFASCCPLEYELGRAQNEYEAIARGEREITAPLDAPDGPFGQGTGEILVVGAPQAVAVVTYGDYRAFRFEVNGVHVTVVSRDETPGVLSFYPITDLTPYLPGALDREELRRQLRERRRVIPE